jgi:hypothetical protein
MKLTQRRLQDAASAQQIHCDALDRAKTRDVEGQALFRESRALLLDGSALRHGQARCNVFLVGQALTTEFGYRAPRRPCCWKCTAVAKEEDQNLVNVSVSIVLYVSV